MGIFDRTHHSKIHPALAYQQLGLQAPSHCAQMFRSGQEPSSASHGLIVAWWHPSLPSHARPSPSVFLSHTVLEKACPYTQFFLPPLCVSGRTDSELASVVPSML